MTRKTAMALAGGLGIAGVIAGTFGAHGLEGAVTPDRLATWETGVLYHMLHAVALLALSATIGRLGRLGAAAAWCFFGGVVVFAGTLYLLVLTGQGWLGAITPIGGVGFIVGWALVIAAGWRGEAAAVGE